MRLDSKKGNKMLSKCKLREVVKDIHAIRTGNFILRENWFFIVHYQIIVNINSLIYF